MSLNLYTRNSILPFYMGATDGFVGKAFSGNLWDLGLVLNTITGFVTLKKSLSYLTIVLFSIIAHKVCRCGIHRQQSK